MGESKCAEILCENFNNMCSLRRPCMRCESHAHAERTLVDEDYFVLGACCGSCAVNMKWCALCDVCMDLDEDRAIDIGWRLEACGWVCPDCVGECTFECDSCSLTEHYCCMGVGGVATDRARNCALTLGWKFLPDGMLCYNCVRLARLCGVEII